MTEERLLNMLIWFIGLFFLYGVIKGAIDSTEIAKNVYEIKKLLSENNKNGEI